jgi:hypothetical protein
VGGFSKERISSIVLSVFSIVIILCALYKRWVLEAIKAASGILFLIAVFCQTCFNEARTANLDDSLLFGMWGTILHSWTDVVPLLRLLPLRHPH